VSTRLVQQFLVRKNEYGVLGVTVGVIVGVTVLVGVNEIVGVIVGV